MRLLILGAGIVLLALAAQAEDFVLIDHEHLDVTITYDRGVLYDFSTANVLEEGWIWEAVVNDKASLSVLGERGGVQGADAYDESTVNLVDGLITGLCDAHGNSTVNVSGGKANFFHLWDNSVLNLSGGNVGSATLHSDSIMKMSGGQIGGLLSEDNSTLNISGGNVGGCSAADNSVVNLSGGTIAGTFSAWRTSTTNIFGYDFRASDGASIVDNKLIGTGVLTGRWFDGTRWVLNVSWRNTDATINLISEWPNTAPTAIADEYSAAENKILTVLAPGVLSNDSDDDGDELHAVLVTSTSHGVLEFSPDGSFRYVPDNNFNREDFFTYVASDGHGESQPATVNITIATAYPWHNGLNPLDVNGDGLITYIDALLIINAVNRGKSGKLPLDRPRPLSAPFYDANRDGFLAPIDALRVINYLQRR